MVTFVALLQACGGGRNPADPLASFKQQKLVWQACDPTLWGVFEKPITDLGLRVKCALMRAPLDYSNPARGELQVALARAAAEQPQLRIGSIVINPGGPGGDGLMFGPLYGTVLTNADPATPAGKLLKEMSSRYDLIGFSPRGVGSSSSLTCSSPELLEVVVDPRFDRSPENLTKVLRNARLQAQGCAKNPLMQYINTDATARDMELMRGILGEPKLNFVGLSYGTWLGVWYASLFPERVGRMLLDSSMNVAGSFDDATLLQEVGTSRVVDQIFAPYAARHPGRFNLGSSAAQVSSALLALPATLQEELFANISFVSSGTIDADVLGMTAAVGLQVLRLRLPHATPKQLHTAIDAYAFTPGPDNAAVSQVAHELATKLLTPRERAPNFTKPSDAVYRAVLCNDMATAGDEPYWVTVGNQYAARYPMFGGASTYNPCLYWSAPVTRKPALAPVTQVGPLLMLQSRFDAKTRIEGAMFTLAALPNARMIVVEDEYKHGLFPYGNSCVDGQVADYFVNGKMPARISSCPGKTLPSDTAAVAASSGQTPQAAAPGAAIYKDVVQSQEMIRGIHSQIDQAARGF